MMSCTPVILIFFLVICTSRSILGFEKVIRYAHYDENSICGNTKDKIDCSNRNLSTNLNDYVWPVDSVQVITFENNQITHIKPFRKMIVNKLIFRNNKIKTIDNMAFKMLENLTELDLSNNLLTSESFLPAALEGKFLPNEYEPLHKLTVLNLSGNKFSYLSKDIFMHVPNLKTLILSNNPFGEFEGSSITAFNNIPYLEELDMSYCKLKTLEKNALQSLRYLKKLDLSWNEFVKLPDALQQSKSLQILILDGNPIKYIGIDEIFPSLPNLKKLTMRSMYELISILRYAFSNLENLETLIIENCTLLSSIDERSLVIPKKIGGAIWPPLKTLDLSNNKMHYLPANLVARWDTLRELHLINNRWYCDCENQYFIGTLLPNDGERLMGNESLTLRCWNPPEHLNKSLMSLSGRKLRCLDIYGARPERDAAILLGILAGVILAVPVVLGLLMLWRRGFFFCGSQGPASFSRAFYKRTMRFDDDDL